MDYSKVPFESCPHCGSVSGFYTKEQATGTVVIRFNYDGSEAENGSMYDGLTYKGGKVAYCTNCNKKLFNMEILKK